VDELAPERVARGEQEIGDEARKADVGDDAERLRRLITQPFLE
jgi:hypothetical protein